MYELQLVDVCLPDYLQDHHNRPGELLLGIPVDGSTLNWQLRGELKMELQSRDVEIDYDAARKVIDSWFNQHDGRRRFRPDLERYLDQREGESAYAYFVLRYPTTGGEPRSCILTAENIDTADDCTLHDHVPED